jgi:hypothetical protein
MPRSRRRAEYVTIPKNTAKLISITVSCRCGESRVTCGHHPQARYGHLPIAIAVIDHHDVIAGYPDAIQQPARGRQRGGCYHAVGAVRAQLIQVFMPHQLELDGLRAGLHLEIRGYKRRLLFETQFHVAPVPGRDAEHLIHQFETRGGGQQDKG